MAENNTTEAQKALDELKANTKRVLELEAQIKAGAEAAEGVSELKGEVNKLATANAELIDKLTAAETKAQERMDEMEAKAKERGARGAAAFKTLGQSFVESEEFKAAAEAGTLKTGQMAPAEVDIHGNAKRQAMKITLTGIDGAPFTVPDFLPEIIRPQDQRTTMRDLIPGGTTSRDRVNYMRLTARATGAEVVGQGQEKPDSNLTLERAEAPVRKIAHWIAVDDEQLDDVEGLRSLIDAEMEYGLQLAEDEEILNGDESSINGTTRLLGIVPQATAYDEALETEIATAANITTVTLLDRIQIAMGQLGSVDHFADGLVLHPISMSVLLLTQTDEGAYKFANPTSGNEPRPWGLRTAVTTRFNQGDFLIGNFRLGAQIFDRMRPRMKVGYVNDQLILNQITIVAEERLALAVKRPGAFVHYDGTPTT